MLTDNVIPLAVALSAVAQGLGGAINVVLGLVERVWAHFFIGGWHGIKRR
jgi:hypothetical protein